MDLEPVLVMRFYEIHGSPAETGAELLGEKRGFQEINLLEEAVGAAGARTTKVAPYENESIKVPWGR